MICLVCGAVIPPAREDIYGPRLKTCSGDVLPGNGADVPQFCRSIAGDVKRRRLEREALSSG